jgi:hypothetical protein
MLIYFIRIGSSATASACRRGLSINSNKIDSPTRVANRTILYSIVLYFDSLYYILLKKYIVRTNTIFWPYKVLQIAQVSVKFGQIASMPSQVLYFFTVYYIYVVFFLVYTISAPKKVGNPKSNCHRC